MSERSRAGLPGFAFVVFLILALDQATKLFVAWSMYPGQSIPVLGDFFRWTFVFNKGAAFGIQLGGRWTFVVVTSMVTVFLVVHFLRSARPVFRGWPMALILGGALGNLVDRVRLGEVVDFIHLSAGGYSWPVFNVADMGISIGVGLIALAVLRAKDPEPPELPGEGGEIGQVVVESPGDRSGERGHEA
ncbi:MAG: signal peptidase II [Gemmatimonadota bacterium]|nr:signal peptidase II [Gemmatimonadota bacterium]